ncbi:MAG: hypothetical protein HWN66_04290 [Candidatus Helarchaeota archaeon]|nr:hypothetical protein [Candidatus Helarchaeota archaeon]
MTEESPWTSFDVAINLILFVILIGFSIYILITKFAWIYLIIWVGALLLYMTCGRYVTCRHCDYLGKPCPSWCMGIIGAKLGFKRSEKKSFCEEGILNLVLFDISFLIIAMIIPIIVYVVQLVTIGLLIFDWVMLIIYIVLVITALVVHNVSGCRKCSIDCCPLSPKK